MVPPEGVLPGHPYGGPGPGPRSASGSTNLHRRRARHPAAVAQRAARRTFTDIESNTPPPHTALAAATRSRALPAQVLRERRIVDRDDQSPCRTDSTEHRGELHSDDRDPVRPRATGRCRAVPDRGSGAGGSATEPTGFIESRSRQRFPRHVATLRPGHRAPVTTVSRRGEPVELDTSVADTPGRTVTTWATSTPGGNPLALDSSVWPGGQAPQERRRPVGIELGEHVVEQEHRRCTGHVVQRGGATRAAERARASVVRPARRGSGRAGPAARRRGRHDADRPG